MDAAFDMQTEVANLAERIVGPVAVQLAQKELDTAVDQIRHAFEQLNSKSAGASVDFDNMAVNILEPLRAKLSEVDFARIVDRLRGAMAGFRQRDEAKTQPEVEPGRLQQAEQRETLHPQPNAQSEPDTEPWWSKSERAMALLILLWLYTGIDWQLH